MSRWRRQLRRLQERLERGPVGTRLQEWLWRTRHLYKKGWAEAWMDTVDHPHRSQIVAAVASFHPARVLEAGCGGGANLARLRQALPEAELHGLDINAAAIAAARRHFAADGRVRLDAGRVDRLDAYADGAVDVVLCDAVLMFLAPDRIRPALAEMARVARAGLVFNEFSAAGAELGRFDGGRWIYDLPALLRAVLPPEARIETAPSAFTGGLWDRYGALVTVRR